MRNNPNYNKWVLPAGYKDLGWQLHSGNSNDIKICCTAGHKIKEFDNSMFQNRCTNVVKICDECRMVWHIDMSD